MIIKETDKGIGFRIGNTIYLNKNLDSHPRLKQAILSHELAHTSRFTLKDLKIDLKGAYLNTVKLDYYKFLIKYPKSLMQFLPAIKIDNNLVIDPLMCIFWLIISIMLILIGVFI